MASAEGVDRSDAWTLRALVARASEPGWGAAGVAVVGVGAQIVAFLLGFRAATSQPPSLGWARVAAVVGLLASLGVLALLARLVDEGWLGSRAAMALLGAGAFVGGVVAFYLPTGTLGAAGELFLYTATILLYGTLVNALILLAAGIAYLGGHAWWRTLLAAPVLLLTGAHAVVLLGLLLQAGSLAEAAIAYPLG